MTRTRTPRTYLLVTRDGGRLDTSAIPCDALVADGPGGIAGPGQLRPCRADAVLRVDGVAANLCRAHALRASAVTVR